MIIKTVHVAQRVAEKYSPEERNNVAIISITGSHDDDAILHPNFKKILRLKFDDIDQEILDDPRNRRVYKGINSEQADLIIAFVEELLDDEEEWYVVVHCHAGISRSAAVSKYISDRADLHFPEDYKVYNKMVYSRLLKPMPQYSENL